MKGFMPVDIPTKKYTKAYMLHKLGPKPIMNRQGNTIGDKLYDLLGRETDERASVFESKHFTERIRVYIPLCYFRQRGATLNKTSVKNFNIFVESELKDRFYFIMDYFISVLPNFQANLPEVRKRLGIDIEAWSDDSMKKDYYRYRLNTGQSLFKETYTQNVPLAS